MAKLYSDEQLKELIAKLSKISSATAHEALGRIGAVSYEIKPIAKGMKVCGPALTVHSEPNDNLTLHEAMLKAKPGDVLLANCGSHRQAGFWGEVMTVGAMAKGINGLVIDSGVRDSAEITALGFPIFSRSVCIQGTIKATPGKINVPIEFGGVLVNPGDIVLGDDDGLVIIPIERLEEAIEKSIERENKERDLMEKLRNGATTFELLGFEKYYNN